MLLRSCRKYLSKVGNIYDYIKAYSNVETGKLEEEVGYWDIGKKVIEKDLRSREGWKEEGQMQSCKHFFFQVQNQSGNDKMRPGHFTENARNSEC